VSHYLQIGAQQGRVKLAVAGAWARSCVDRGWHDFWVAQEAASSAHDHQRHGVWPRRCGIRVL